MVNFVSKLSFFSYFSFLVLFSWGKSILRNLHSYKSLSYSTYEPWSLRGELNFVFKTSQTNAFLAYQDNGQNEFIEIFLSEGNIRFKTLMGNCYVAEIYVQGEFSDLHWHRVRVVIEQNNFSISVDDTTGMLPCNPPVHHHNRRADGNYLYVASFSPMIAINLNLLVWPGTFHQVGEGFSGCLGDLWISDNRGRLKLAEVISTQSTEIGCNSSCSTPQLNKCQNQGKCIDEIGRVECDCLGSGYEGLLCSKPSVSLWLNASGYILYDVGTHQPEGRSDEKNNIAFRFATTQPRGVVMFTDVADDHVIVEMADGFLRVSWDLGQGGLVLMSREGCLDDGAWHMVTIKRTKRRIRITVDDHRPIFAVIPGKFSYLDFKGAKKMMYFGGGPQNKAFNRSLSRTNYTGFLQHLYFDEFNVINETLHGSMFEVVGKAVLNASSYFHVITTIPTPAGDCPRKTNHNSEYLCEGSDDEDLCDITTSGAGLDGPDCDSTDGDCPDPDIQEITGGPSVVVISPVNHSSSQSVSMTSRIQPSSTSTTLPGMTKYIIKSGASKTEESTVKSANMPNHLNSISNTFNVEPSITAYRSAVHSIIQEKPIYISGIPTSLISSAVPKHSGLKSTIIASVSSSLDIKNNTSSLKPVRSNTASTTNDSSLTSKYSAALTIPYENLNISAVKGAANEAVRHQILVYEVLLVCLYSWI